MASTKPSKKTITAQLPAIESISSFLCVFGAELPEQPSEASAPETDGHFLDNLEPLLDLSPAMAVPAAAILVPEIVRSKVTAISRETLRVQVTLASGLVVSAEPFQWGGKMLMKVQDTAENAQLTRGEKISVGQLAKRALTACGLILPTAVLKRPRTSTVVETAAAAEAQLETLADRLEGITAQLEGLSAAE